jgi:two-component system, NtrC family, response regulator PilR
MAHRILVVDDQPSILFSMKDYLERVGHAVDCACSVAEARLLLEAFPYSLVIADLRLTAAHPGDGLELLGHVKASSPEIRTILLTAYGTLETERQARRIGVDAQLNKSLDLAEIAEVVGRLPARPC